MNHSFANLSNRFTPVPRDAKDRIAKDRHLIGKRRLDPEDAEELVFAGDVVILFGWLVFDDDNDVLKKGGEALGERVERLTHEALELHCRNLYQPGMMLKPNTQFFVGR